MPAFADSLNIEETFADRNEVSGCDSAERQGWSVPFPEDSYVHTLL